MGSFSIWHWLVVLVAIAMVFGTKKLRNLGEDLGGAIKGFKKGMKDAANEPAASEALPESQTAQGQGDTIDVQAREKA